MRLGESSSSSISFDYQSNNNEFIESSYTLENEEINKLSKEGTIKDMDYTKVSTPSSIKRLMNRKSVFVKNKENKNLINNFDIFSNTNETKKSKWLLNPLLDSHLENKFEIEKPTIIQSKVLEKLKSNNQNIVINYNNYVIFTK